jgi:anti-sigma-K factor RskA
MTDAAQPDVLGLTGAVALDAASAEEERALLALLDHSDELAAELRGLRETAAQLGLAVAPEQPSEALGARIMHLVAATPQSGALAASAHLVPRRRRRARVVLAGLVIAAAAVAGVIVLSTSLRPVAPTVYEQISAAADAKSSTADVTGGGTLRATWSQSVGAAAVQLDGVPAVPADKAYELWYVTTDGSAHAAGLVPAGASGWVPLDGALAAGSTIAMTVEPSTGSPQPTTTPVVAVTT